MNFTDLLTEHRIPYRREGQRCRPGWIQLDCPYCSPSAGKYYMGYSLSGGYVNCWFCGWHRMTDTIMMLTGMLADQAKSLLRDIVPQRLERKKVLGKLTIPHGVGPMLYAHKKYLADRDLDPKQIETLWKVGGIGIATRLQWRLYIPIHLGEDVVSWTTRSIGKGHNSRYISASLEQEAYPHKTLLYGEQYVRHAAVVHEGPADVWATGPGAVALCGTAYSRPQVLRLAKIPVRVICFDNEPAAQMRARKLCDELEVFPGQTCNVVLSGKDAASSPKSDIQEIRKKFLD